MSRKKIDPRTVLQVFFLLDKFGVVEGVNDSLHVEILDGSCKPKTYISQCTAEVCTALVRIESGADNMFEDADVALFNDLIERMGHHDDFRRLVETLVEGCYRAGWDARENYSDEKGVLAVRPGRKPGREYIALKAEK